MKKVVIGGIVYFVIGGLWYLAYTNIQIPVTTARVPQPGAAISALPADLGTVALWPWSMVASLVNALPSFGS